MKEDNNLSFVDLSHEELSELNGGGIMAGIAVGIAIYDATTSFTKGFVNAFHKEARRP